MSADPSDKAVLDATLPPEEPSKKALVDPTSGILALGATLDGNQNQPTSPEPEFPVTRWDRYEFIRLLGRGGMGTVYLARDRRLGRTVALKFIRSGDPNLAIRFLQEARAQARIDHPNVCKVYEVGEVERQSYISMQYVDGKSLESASLAMTGAEKVIIIRQVAEAMHEAHRLGIIHRDIKPSNIMVERGEGGSLVPVVMDFGLARESTEGHGLTESGAVLGTPAYMAPEQARGDVRAIDRRSDVYSLGATLYELLAGVPPFCAESVVDLLLKVISEEAPLLRTHIPSIAPDLEIVVMKCLNREPNQRYDSAKALAEDLGRYLNGEHIIGKRVSLLYRLRRGAWRHRSLVAVSALFLVVVLGLGIYFLRERAAERHERVRLAERARLERELAPQIKDMEWLLRSARQLPLHDLGREKAIIRKRMSQLQVEMASYAALGGQALAHYALGRGHMALQEYPQALIELRQAMAQGHQSAEAHYALGFVLGQHFEQAIAEVRMSGGGEWAKSQLKEIEPKYLAPALASLQRSRSLNLEAPQYLEGLIAFYKRDYETALNQADAALAQAPWLYEAARLAGRVHFERAVQTRDGGNYPKAEAEFAAAVRRYEEAARIGQSDALVYEDLAEAWVRQIEMAMFRGQSVEAAYARALAASDKLLEADPGSTMGPLKKAFAAMMTVGVMGAGRTTSERIQACLSASQAALSRQPENPYASYTAAMCRLLAAENLREQGQDPEPLVHQTIGLLEGILRKYPKFLWAINDLANAYCTLGHQQYIRGSSAAKESLLKSVKYYAMAADVDPSYVNAVGNTLAVYAEIIPLLDTEAEIARLLTDAASTFDRCIQINAHFSGCFINYALPLVRASLRFHLAGHDQHRELTRARQLLATSRTEGGNLLEIEQITALVQLLEARDRVRRRQDPGPILAEMKKALDQCLALADQDATCWTLSAKREWVAAEWHALQGKQHLLMLQQALACAEKATRSRESTPDSWQALGASHLRLARAQVSQAVERDKHIAMGLVATARISSINAAHAQGLATQGGLLLLRAQTQKETTPRRASAMAAVASLETSLRNDRLLAHEYGNLLEQARAVLLAH